MKFVVMLDGSIGLNGTPVKPEYIVERLNEGILLKGAVQACILSLEEREHSLLEFEEIETLMEVIGFKRENEA